MSLETATYLADLQPANPPSTDPTSQGDDHLRLIKQVLQTTFPGGSRTYPVPTTLAKTTNYTIVKNDGEGVIYVSTAGGAVTLTLPTLAAVDQGWKINFIKTSLDVNPVFIAPAAGTLNSGGYAGLARARRCIPGARSTAVWDGAAWFITRVSPAPIGCMLDFYGATLPLDRGLGWCGLVHNSGLSRPDRVHARFLRSYAPCGVRVAEWSDPRLGRHELSRV
jgi:hypothetical protein